MSISGIMCEIKEKDDESPQITTRTVVEMTNDSVYIHPQEYGDTCSPDGYGCPVMLERWNGELRVVIWADINQEDPTHIISLEGAKESKRIE